VSEQEKVSGLFFCLAMIEQEKVSGLFFCLAMIDWQRYRSHGTSLSTASTSD